MTADTALVVGHSPTNEAAILGLTGEIVDPISKGAGVRVSAGAEGFRIERLDTIFKSACARGLVIRARGGWGLGIYDEAPVPADRGDALAASGGSANAIVFPSGSGTLT